MRINITFLGLLLLAAVFGEGCKSGPGTQPPQPFLTLTESWPDLSSDLTDSIVGQLKSGAMTLDEPRLATAFQRMQCIFTADYNTSGQPNFQANGTPGSMGFNIQLISSRLRPVVSSAVPCPSGEPVPTEIILQPSQGISIGRRTHQGGARVTLDGDTFSTSRGFFEFTLTTFDQNSHKAVGDFRLLLRNDANQQDTRVMVVSAGSFLMPL